MIPILLIALTLRPPSHEVPQPGAIQIPVENAARLRHTRWKAGTLSGEWLPPKLVLSKPGTYWISAAEPERLRTLSAKEFSALAQAEGLELIRDYRSQYKLEAQPVRILRSQYAKTMLRIGPRNSDNAPVVLNLAIEFVLRGPNLVQLNFRSQPIAGIPVLANGKLLGYTNAAGQLPLGNVPGAVELRASVVRGYPDRSTADWEVFTASLTLPEAAAR
ncbi:MAG: hypothetical protein OHK0021_08330 [Bryobacter sp.]